MPAHSASKSHLIASTPWLDPETKRWTPKVSIICPAEEAGTQLINRPVFKINFASEQQARSEGVVFAQKWIDDGQPDLHKDKAPNCHRCVLFSFHSFSIKPVTHPFGL
jgi:hypothetical protein